MNFSATTDLKLKLNCNHKHIFLKLNTKFRKGSLKTKWSYTNDLQQLMLMIIEKYLRLNRELLEIVNQINIRGQTSLDSRIVHTFVMSCTLSPLWTGFCNCSGVNNNFFFTWKSIKIARFFQIHCFRCINGEKKMNILKNYQCLRINYSWVFLKFNSEYAQLGIIAAFYYLSKSVISTLFIYHENM